jgi:hypothetical protein
MERSCQRWLQTQYPALLARRLIFSFRGLSAIARKGFEREVLELLAARTFERQLFINRLWVSDKSFTMEWSSTPSFTRGPRRSVRCSLTFQEILDDFPSPISSGYDPVQTLYQLFEAIVPYARRVFQKAYSPLRLLHVNDYDLEKAFVFGIVALSKWMGEERFPYGVYGQWPPNVSPDLVTKYHASEPIQPDTTGSQPSVLPPKWAPMLARIPHLDAGLDKDSDEMRVEVLMGKHWSMRCGFKAVMVLPCSARADRQERTEDQA